ncbi:thiol:disulfide interchange protein DsbA/DsbL [Lysobacter sp. A286]
MNHDSAKTHLLRSRRSGGSFLARAAIAAIFVALPMIGFAAAPTGDLVAGTDYIEIPDGAPFATPAGQIEVVEVFGYTCPHCAHFEPLVSAWKAKLPADVNFVEVPAPFGGYWIPYAQAFYTAQAQGLVARTHAPMFRALHQEHSLPISGATPAEIAAFYARYGADPEQFANTMTSPAIQAQLKQARDFLRRSGVEGTPTLIVNGKYRVLGNSATDLLDNAAKLVERERSRRAQPQH